MIYMDNAATTAVRKEVAEAMLPYLWEIMETRQVCTGCLKKLKMLLRNQEILLQI